MPASNENLPEVSRGDPIRAESANLLREQLTRLSNIGGGMHILATGAGTFSRSLPPPVATELYHGTIIQPCNLACSAWIVQRKRRIIQGGCEDCGSGSGVEPDYPIGSGSGDGCTTQSGYGNEEIVGVEGEFLGLVENPDADVRGHELLLALIDDRLWPIQVCGDTGVGKPFPNLSPMNVLTEEEDIDPDGTGVVAYGCLLNCDYRITTDLSAEVIIGKIDGQWHILRVRNSATTSPVFGSNHNCRCCGINPSNTLLEAEIVGASGGCADLIGTVIPLQASYRSGNLNFAWYGEATLSDCDGSGPGSTGANGPLSIGVRCNAEEASALEELDDWYVEVCGQEATVSTLQCCGDTGSGSGSGACGLLLSVSTGALTDCCSCEFSIIIRQVGGEPCIEREDVPIKDVVAEACGLPDLADGTRVIVVHAPRSPSDPSDAVEWFIIRACDSEENCGDSCDEPPGVPATCCGVECPDLPETLTFTIAVTDCDCACGDSVTLTKAECAPGVERGEWRYEPPANMCDTLLNYLEITEIILVCGDDSPGGSGSGARDFYLTVNGITVPLIDGMCNPIVLEFADGPSPGICRAKFPGDPDEDLNCNYVITITE